MTPLAIVGSIDRHRALERLVVDPNHRRLADDHASGMDVPNTPPSTRNEVKSATRASTAPFSTAAPSSRDHPGQDAGAIRAGRGEIELPSRFDFVAAQLADLQVEPGQFGARGFLRVVALGAQLLQLDPRLRRGELGFLQQLLREQSLARQLLVALQLRFERGELQLLHVGLALRCSIRLFFSERRFCSWALALIARSCESLSTVRRAWLTSS